MTIASWGFAPALAAGNAVVLKPAEWTPLTAMRLGELALEAGLPEGLFQVLPGKGSVVGERFVTHDRRAQDRLHRLDRGRQASRWRDAPAQVKPVTLELGGKSANIVFADADLEKAAATAPGCGVRQRGAGLLRAQPHPRRAQRLRPLPRAARARGARRGEWATRATRDDRDGAARFEGRTSTRCALMCRMTRPSRSAARRPTAPASGSRRRVLTPTSRTDRTVVDEIFGPVVTVLPFDDEADAIALANDERLRT